MWIGCVYLVKNVGGKEPTHEVVKRKELLVMSGAFGR